MEDKKVAIVTGASRGIGKAIALGFAKEGYNVCIVSRDVNLLKHAAEEITKETNQEVIYCSADVSDLEAPARILNIVIKKFNRIDILVNNTGGPASGSFLLQDDESWMSAIQQNLLSVIRFTKAVVPYMKEQNGGRIINISSTVAKEPSSVMVLSATTRAGVSAFSKSISQELAPFNITVNTICPGGVLTQRLKSLVEEASIKNNISYEEQMSKSLEIIPINRFAEPEEIANVACFLADDKSSYLTGASIMVDGGLTKGIF
ncbi:MAG: SDR family oxidoreductase [Sulfurimonas sp.]|jgi:3-oxoacyl-[acyl-carrier protein] reductase